MKKILTFVFCIFAFSLNAGAKETTYNKVDFDKALSDGKVVVVSSWIKYCTSCASQMKVLNKAKTAFLWIGPFVLFFAAIWFMLRAIKTRQLNNEESSLTEQQLKEASSILRVKEKDGPYE